MADVGAISSGDTAWVLISAGLVLFMTPGLALFYGGMVRSKHVLSMLAQNFATIGVVSVVWVVLAYSIAFDGDAGDGLIGKLGLAGFAHARSAIPGIHLTVPPVAFGAFQMMFAVITAALLTGAGADRMRFGPYLAFAGLWTLIVYAPLAHWVFDPNGCLAKQGLLDFSISRTSISWGVPIPWDPRPARATRAHPRCAARRARSRRRSDDTGR